MNPDLEDLDRQIGEAFYNGRTPTLEEAAFLLGSATGLARQLNQQLLAERQHRIAAIERELTQLRDMADASALAKENAELREALAEIYFHLGPPQPSLTNHLDVVRLVAKETARRDQLQEALAEVVHAVSELQKWHVQLGTADDPDEEEALKGFVSDAVEDLLNLKLPLDLLPRPGDQLYRNYVPDADVSAERTP